MFWKMAHFFFAALAIILVGVHVGLHWNFIKSMFLKLLKLPRVIARPLGIVCLAGILLYGGYSATTTSFPRWLATPITAFNSQSGNMHQTEIDKEEGSSDAHEKPENFTKHGNELDKFGGKPIKSSLSIQRILSLLASFGAITALIAAMTVLIEKMSKKFRKRGND